MYPIVEYITEGYLHGMGQILARQLRGPSIVLHRKTLQAAR